MIKVIKKEDVLKRLDDPKRDDIERRLREMFKGDNSRALRIAARERPERLNIILSYLQDFKVELEQAHAE